MLSFRHSQFVEQEVQSCSSIEEMDPIPVTPNLHDFRSTLLLATWRPLMASDGPKPDFAQTLSDGIALRLHLQVGNCGGVQQAGGWNAHSPFPVSGVVWLRERKRMTP